MGAIEKINAEMQKAPGDAYLEIIGQYVIDRCMDPAIELVVAEKDKTLKDALSAVKDSAKKKAKNGVAVLTPAEVFRIVDQYFGIPKDVNAQIKAMSSETAIDQPKQESNVINLADFL